MSELTSKKLTIHTPGPWRWEVSEKGRRVQLCGGLSPQYDLTIMDFVRWGTNSAAPRFIDQDELLSRAEEYAVVVPGREHHATWFKTIDHPDATLMAAAPDLLALARQYASECATCSGTGNSGNFEVGDEHCGDCADIRAVIEKATKP
jgi:hypothetical protein